MKYFTGTVMGVSGTVHRFVVKDEPEKVKSEVIPALDNTYDGCDKELTTQYDSAFYTDWKRSGKRCHVGADVREKNIVKDIPMKVTRLGCCCCDEEE